MKAGLMVKCYRTEEKFLVAFKRAIDTYGISRVGWYGVDNFWLLETPSLEEAEDINEDSRA